MANNIYLDHAATTPVHPRVLEAMWPYFSQQYHNPSSVYAEAKANHRVLENAREQLADMFNARPGEIIFTSGGSEGDTTAIVGAALANRSRGNHIITTQVEHHAVLHTAQYLEQRHGFRVTYLPVDRYGMVSLEALEAALDDETVLVSIMYANNEVGTVEPVAEIGRLLRERDRRILFHTDAVQAAGAFRLDVDELGVDLLTISAHKFYGPKGVGVLYVRRGVEIDPLVHGGAQERGRRAGTENIPGIIGMIAALQLAVDNMDAINTHLLCMRDRLISGVLETVPGAILTGHPTLRLPNHASFVFQNVEGETILLDLEAEGFACSSGSACTATSNEPSHVLLAMGIPPELAHTAVRMTLGWENTPDQVEQVLAVLPGIVERLRSYGVGAEG